MISVRLSVHIRSGSSGRVRRGARNIKSMQPPSVAIFFMTYFHRAGGGHGPLGPPWIRYCTLTEFVFVTFYCSVIFLLNYWKSHFTKSYDILWKCDNRAALSEFQFPWGCCGFEKKVLFVHDSKRKTYQILKWNVILVLFWIESR